MIDLEDALAALVERAPQPPTVDRVVRRARERRLRRRGARATALVVLVAGIAGAITVASSRNPSKVSVLNPAIESVRVTMLDGSQLEISGPRSLGLAKLTPSFNAQLDYPSPEGGGYGHSFSVQRDSPDEPGAILGRFPTHDGHELVVHETPTGVDAVVQYEHWTLVAAWNDRDTGAWANWAEALNARETPDGFLMFEPVSTRWRLGPTDAPDVQLGADGRGVALSFFGPAIYPAGCPNASETVERTAQGWPVSTENGNWWCDAEAKVRVRVGGDADLVDAATEDLRVKYTGSGHAVMPVTTLDGSELEITAPSSVLDYFVQHATLEIDGLDASSPIDVTVDREPEPLVDSEGRQPKYETADGHRLMLGRREWTQDTVLSGTYGDWTVRVSVSSLTDAQRARVASLFAAHESAGFVVLDPHAPMHLVQGQQPDIGLDGVAITSHDYVLDGNIVPAPRPGGTFGVVDNVNHPELVGKIQVRRVG